MLVLFFDMLIIYLFIGLIVVYKGGIYGYYLLKGFFIIKLFLINMIYDVVLEVWKKVMLGLGVILKNLYIMVVDLVRRINDWLLMFFFVRMYVCIIICKIFLGCW